MPNKAQWTVIVIGAILGAFLLVSLGGLAGWAFSRSPGSGWGWPLRGWMGPGMMGGWASPGGTIGPGRGTCGLGGMMGLGGVLAAFRVVPLVAPPRHLASLRLGKLWRGIWPPSTSLIWPSPR